MVVKSLIFKITHINSIFISTTFYLIPCTYLNLSFPICKMGTKQYLPLAAVIREMRLDKVNTQTMPGTYASGDKSYFFVVSSSIISFLVSLSTSLVASQIFQWKIETANDVRKNRSKVYVKNQCIYVNTETKGQKKVCQNIYNGYFWDFWSDHRYYLIFELILFLHLKYLHNDFV